MEFLTIPTIPSPDATPAQRQQFDDEVRAYDLALRRDALIAGEAAQVTREAQATATAASAAAQAGFNVLLGKPDPLQPVEVRKIEAAIQLLAGQARGGKTAAAHAADAVAQVNAVFAAFVPVTAAGA